MAYFRNTVVNLLNLHYGIFAVVMSGGGAFYCVYLLKAGVAAPAVLAAMAGIVFFRFAVRPAVVGLAVRFGLQRMLVVGTVLLALQFPLLPNVHGIGWPLLILIIVSAIGDAVYWSCYHAYFASLGDDEHRGHQVSIREAIVAAVGVVSPVVTGWLLVTFGPSVAFGYTCAVTMCAAVPLLWAPNVTVARDVPGAVAAARFGIKMFVLDGWMNSGFVFVWQIALFLSLGQSFVNFGGALAAAALVGGIAGLFLGRHIDSGGGARAVLIAMAMMSAIVLLRATTPGNFTLALVANAFTALGTCLYTPTLMTAVYNEAKRSSCALRFHVATEGGWDTGCAAGCLIAAALLWLGLPMQAVLLLPLLAIAISTVQLRRYYALHQDITELEGAEIAGGPTVER